MSGVVGSPAGRGGDASRSSRYGWSRTSASCRGSASLTAVGSSSLLRLAIALGRTLGLPVVGVVGTGECITLYAPPAAGLTPAAGDGSLASWPAGCPIEPSPTV